MIALKPHGTFTYSPPEDADRPEAERRVLTVRILSAGEWLDYADGFEAAMKLDDEREHMHALAALVAGVAVGATADTLLRAFTPLELQHHARHLAESQTLSEIDAKKSAWRLPSPAAKSAAPASPASA